MKQIIGMVLIVAGVIFGVWAGLWWALIGGIIDIINTIKAPDIVAMDIAIGIVKIMFASAIGGFSTLLAIIPGYVMVMSE